MGNCLIMTIRIDGTNTAANPGITGTDADTGLQFGTDEVSIVTGGTDRVTVDSSGNVGIGSSSPSAKLQVNSGDIYIAARSGSTETGIFFRNPTDTATNAKIGYTDTTGNLVLGTTNTYSTVFVSNDTERMVINSSGKIQVTGTRGGSLQPSDDDSLELYTSATSGNANTGCGLTFYNHDSSGFEMGGTIQVAKDNGTADNTASYMRFSTRTNGSSVAERLRLDSDGRMIIGKTTTDFNTAGQLFNPNGSQDLTRNGGPVLFINRTSNDGTLVSFYQGGSSEGSISVSGSTVSYNGAHLSRWSQLAGGTERTEILRGSVLSNLDEMCEWAYDAQDAVLYTEDDELPEGVSVGDVKTPAVAAGTENNEQLNRMQVSDVEGDRNVSGVFQAWDDDDDTYINDFYCAMTGDFVIRIAQGTTVTRGDLLMSAGDGTAKPQDDDIVRSKTIAKVTSTTVSTTYSDNSYCVPCVLMTC